MSDLFYQKAAILSPDGLYRYSLSRTWDASRPALVWIMLNPSVADAEVDDPTIRRVCGLTQFFGDYGGAVVVNLFSFRATDPAAMRQAADPVGPANDEAIRAALADGPPWAIVAWGAGGSYRDRDRQVLDLLRAAGVKPKCFGTTKDGFPRHPLYLVRHPESKDYEGRL